MKKKKLFVCIMLALVALFSGQAMTQEGEVVKDESCPAGMTPEQMAKWAEVATPGEQHQELEGMVGTWNSTIKWWAAPGAPPVESTGTTVNSSVLGGRFIRQSHQGLMMGQSFQGLGFIGYDNYKEKLVSVWMDNMGTMMMISEGTSDPSGNTCTLFAEFDDPMTGMKTAVREVITVIDDDHHTMEMYMSMSEGKEFRTMEIKYVRQ